MPGPFHGLGAGWGPDPVRNTFRIRHDARSRDGIIAWSAERTDDGTMMIIHVVAVNRHAFDTILADTRPEVKVFEIGVDSRQAIEAIMQKYKAGFNLDSFRVVAQ